MSKNSNRIPSRNGNPNCCAHGIFYFYYCEECPQEDPVYNTLKEEITALKRDLQCLTEAVRDLRETIENLRRDN